MIGRQKHDISTTSTATSGKTSKYEETTVFTRAARREMSDLWYHGASRCEPGDEEEEEEEDSVFSRGRSKVKSQPQPPTIPAPAPAAPGFNFFEESTTNVRKTPAAEAAIPPPPKPMFRVFEEEAAADVVPARGGEEEKKRVPLAPVETRKPEPKEAVEEEDEDKPEFRQPAPRE